MNECGRSALKRRLIVALAVLCAGCSTSASRVGPDPDKVRIAAADRAGYDTTIRNLRGDVVLVDFWAHWCDSCVEKFPHIVELANREWPRGLSLVTVDMDAPEAVEKTTAFLKEQRAGAAVNLISQLGGGSDAMETFEIPKGSLPCYKLYDRKGQLRETFGDRGGAKAFTLQEIDAAVEQLLAE